MNQIKKESFTFPLKALVLFMYYEPQRHLKIPLNAYVHFASAA